jgi:hypothetical protein
MNRSTPRAHSLTWRTMTSSDLLPLSHLPGRQSSFRRYRITVASEKSIHLTRAWRESEHDRPNDRSMTSAR